MYLLKYSTEFLKNTISMLHWYPTTFVDIFNFLVFHKLNGLIKGGII